MAECQSTSILTVTPLSRAGSLPQEACFNRYSAIGQAQENRRQLLDARLIVSAKPRQFRAVQIQYANQSAVLDQGHHQLAVRRTVAGNMPRERVNVFDTLGLQSGGRRPAHSATKRNPHTGDLALEWAKHQFFVAIEVETSPVQVIELVKHKRRKLRGIGDEIPLARQQ